MQIQYRSLPMTILLSIITCGIYGIYWFVVMTDDVAYLADDGNMTGIKAMVFSILTCGIYYYYWNYKMGQYLSDVRVKRGTFSDDKGLLFVILAIFGLSIVNYCIIQDELNQWTVQAGQ